jgi:hypothetical protein
MKTNWSGRATLVKYLKEYIKGDKGFFVKGMIKIYRQGLVERLVEDVSANEKKEQIKNGIRTIL